MLAAPIIGSAGRLFISVERTEINQLRFRRRKAFPPPWIPPKFHPVRAELFKEDRKLIEEKLAADPSWSPPDIGPPIMSIDTKHNYMPYHLVPGVANPPDCRGNVYNINSSKRIGMVGRKIGMTLQWLTDGTRCLCTVIHFPQNVVLSANDPATWYRESPTGRLKAFGKRGPFWSQMVGAEDHESVFYTTQYRQIFQRAGVPCKELMAGFLVSEDAIVQPGTPLDVRHFQVGDYVNVSGKSIDWGFQGVMHRWGMKGQQKNRTTKSHRRVGSIGGKSEAKVWLGRRLPGHMGYEWSHATALRVLRINPIEQVIYILGSVPGDIGEMLLVKDAFAEDKRARNPPFPTFYPPEDDFTKFEGAKREELHQIDRLISRDIYHPRLFQFTQPSIQFTDADETKSKARDKSKAKTAKVKK